MVSKVSDEKSAENLMRIPWMICFFLVPFKICFVWVFCFLLFQVWLWCILVWVSLLHLTLSSLTPEMFIFMYFIKFGGFGHYFFKYSPCPSVSLFTFWDFHNIYVCPLDSVPQSHRSHRMFASTQFFFFFSVPQPQ